MGSRRKTRLTLLLLTVSLLVDFCSPEIDGPPTPDPEYANLFTEPIVDKPFTLFPQTTEIKSQIFEQQQGQTTQRPATTTPPPLALNLQACCGTNCVKYDSLMGMVGLQCCGNVPVNFFDKICCGGTASDRRVGNKYFDRCCGTRAHSWDQTCCNGQVFDGANLSCCGSQPYNIYDSSSLCCGGVLARVVNGTVSPACCGKQLYDASGGKQICCGGTVADTGTSDSCCVGYKTSPTATPPAAPFNSATQICCDKVLQKSPAEACCYVQVPQTDPNIIPPPRPTPYKTANQCCDFSGVKARPSTGC